MAFVKVEVTGHRWGGGAELNAGWDQTTRTPKFGLRDTSDQGRIFESLPNNYWYWAQTRGAFCAHHPGRADLFTTEHYSISRWRPGGLMAPPDTALTVRGFPTACYGRTGVRVRYAPGSTSQMERQSTGAGITEWYPFHFDRGWRYAPGLYSCRCLVSWEPR